MNCCVADLVFLHLLREGYFHPSRDAEFPSPEMKNLALAAMVLLWEKDAVFLFGKRYGKRKIHDVIIGQMMPEHLDKAVDFFVHSKELTTIDHLVELIFACEVHDETLVDIQFEHDFGGAA